MLSNGRSLQAVQYKPFHITLPNSFCDRIIKENESLDIIDGTVESKDENRRSSKISWIPKDKFPKENITNNSAISSDKNASEKPPKEPAPIEVKAEEKPVLAEKPIPTKPKRKKTEKLPKVDLNSVGLKLVETSSKPISEPKKESSKKAPPKKVADWQKQKTDKKDTKELVMVETKTTKATKPKKTTKPKAAPKTKKAKVTSKKD